jgi:hypothetical protein
MPLSNLGYVDHMSIKCKDIITNMKYLSQNIMKSVDLIKLIDSSTVHLYFVVQQRTGPGRAVPGAARSLARRPGRLLTPRRRGAPSVVGPAEEPARCAAALQATQSRAQRPGRSSLARRPDRLLTPRRHDGAPSVVGPADEPARCAAALRHNFFFSLDMSPQPASVRPAGPHQSVPPARISPSPLPASVRPPARPTRTGISPSPRPASVRPITETRIWQGGKGGGSARAWRRAQKPDNDKNISYKIIMLYI